LSATWLVNRVGVFNASAVYLTAMFLGTLTWALGAGALLVMGAGVALWGTGFAAFNSMQQARLVTTAPALASATIALNTSANYVGQAAGSALGGVMFSHALLLTMGYAATFCMLAALATLMVTKKIR
jgi:predicted MFS family arabinose efflux permease